MSNPQHAQAQARPVWMFMAATAMATTVSTLAATAMVKAEATEPVAVECTCQTPAPVAEASASQTPAPVEVEPTEPTEPAEPAEPAEEDDKVTAPTQTEQTPLPKAEVEGALDKDIIRRIVRAHINEVRYCYNEGLTLDPELSGRVVVQATVGKDGKVARSEVESTDMEGEVPECIAEAMGRWMFPRPADGKNVVITYPFLLEPG